MKEHGLEKYRIFRSKNKVVAISTFAGKDVKGVAKCHPLEEFDEDYGIQLAAARCNLKIAQKRTKRATECWSQAIDDFIKAKEHLDNMRQYYIDSAKAESAAEMMVEEILS